MPLQEESATTVKDGAGPASVGAGGSSSLEQAFDQSCVANSSSGSVASASHNATLLADLERVPTYMYLIAACASLNSLSLGYEIGISVGVAMLLEDQMNFKGMQVGVFFGCLHLSAAFAGLCSHTLSNRWGCRFVLIFAQLVQAVGILAVSFAGGFSDVIGGRLVIGAGIGLALSIDPVYIAETAPASSRGQLTSMSELAKTLGIVFGFSANWMFARLPAGVNWRAMVAVGSLNPIIFVTLVLTVMPESPRWLYANSRLTAAADVLRRTQADGAAVDTIMEQMRIETHQDEAMRSFGAHTLRPVLVVVGVAFVQQINAFESIIFYLPKILRKAHVDSSADSFFAMALIVGILQVAFVLVFAAHVDSTGRRPLFLVSGGAISVSLCLMAAGSSSALGPVAVVGVVSLAGFFSLGLGPATWLLAAESFPSYLRAKSVSIAVFVNRITCAVMAFTFVPLCSALGGQAVYFFVLQVVTGIATAIMSRYVSETKGRTLEEIAATRFKGGRAIKNKPKEHTMSDPVKSAV